MEEESKESVSGSGDVSSEEVREFLSTKRRTLMLCTAMTVDFSSKRCFSGIEIVTVPKNRSRDDIVVLKE